MLQSLVLSAVLMGQTPATPTPMEALTNGRPQMMVQGALPPTVVDSSVPIKQELFLDRQPQDQPRTQTIVGTPYPLKAASEDDGAFSGSVTLNQDTFFGFYPILNGSYALNDKFALTFYGLFWTNPAFTPSGTGGTGLWTEIAGGISFKVLDDAITVNPALGFLSGKLLSGADRAMTFEGIVSQVSISHASKYLEAQAFGAYYVATAAPSNNNFFHYWLTGGVRPFADCTDWKQIVSVGAHFEQLYQTKSPAGNSTNIYTWLGPYVQLTLPNNVFLRVNAGWDLQDTVSGNFYKVTMGYVF